MPSKSTSSWTKKDSVSGFFRFKACIAARRNCREEIICSSLGRNFRYCTKTRAATYKQKARKGFIYKLLAVTLDFGNGIHKRWIDRDGSTSS